MFAYPVEFSPDDNGTIMVTVPDIPEVVTFGHDERSALAHAGEAIETVLAGYIEDRRDIPRPSKAGRRPVVILPLLAALKLETYVAMRAKGWRKADLARAMERSPRQIDRLFDLHHATPVPQLEAALAACERRLFVEARAA